MSLRDLFIPRKPQPGAFVRPVLTSAGASVIAGQRADLIADPATDQYIADGRFDYRPTGTMLPEQIPSSAINFYPDQVFGDKRMAPDVAPPGWGNWMYDRSMRDDDEYSNLPIGGGAEPVIAGDFITTDEGIDESQLVMLDPASGEQYQ